MPKYAEEILAAVTELQQHPKAEQVFLEMKREHPSIALGTAYLPRLPGAGNGYPKAFYPAALYL